MPSTPNLQKTRDMNPAVSALICGFLFSREAMRSSVTASSVVEGKMASAASRNAVTTVIFFSLNFSKMAWGKMRAGEDKKKIE